MSASGGGSHPSHLPIPTPTPSGNQILPQSGSLQTPDTSALFISSLGDSGDSSGGGRTNFISSPLNRPQSFTSLEELLNVTGISSLELEQSDKTRKARDFDHGVGSLQEMAREVEKNQGRTEPPPSKRVCPDSSVNNTLPHQQAFPNQTVQVPSNIRIQPLHSPSSSSPSSSPPQNSLSSTQQAVTPIASLLDKGNLPSNHLNTLSVSNSNSSGSTLLPPIHISSTSLPPPPPYNHTPVTSISELSTSLNGPIASGFSNTSPNQFLSSQIPPANEVSSGRQQPPTVVPQMNRTQNSPAAQNSGGPTNKTTDSINHNSKSIMLQLMQLYKQYQGLNDQQGMARVRDRLNLLVSAQQKILAAQNNMIKSEGGNPSQSLGQQSRTGVGLSTKLTTTMGSIGGQTLTSQQQVQHQQQEQRANQILSGLSALGKAPQTQQRTASNTMSWQSTSVKGVPQQPPPPYSASTAVSSANNQTAGVGSSSDSTGGAYLPRSVSNMPPSLLSHMGTSSTTTTTPSQLNSSQLDTQKAVKQIQVLMAALPDSKRPKTVQELKDFVQKYSSSLVSKAINPVSPVINNTLPKATVLPVTNLPSATPLQFGSSSENPDAKTQSLQGQISPLSQSAQYPQSSPPINTLTQTAESQRSSQFATTTQSMLGPSQDMLSRHLPYVTPMSSSSGPSMTTLQLGDVSMSKQPLHQLALSNNSTIHAPVTTQFKQSISSSTAASHGPTSVFPVGKQNPVSSGSSTSTGSGIQAGVAMPLPPGLTLETLGVLCRLPETELLKLNLPQTLLSAIRVWKARQLPGTRAKVSSVPNKNNIPVLIPPEQSASSNATTNYSNSSMVTFSKSNTTPHHGPVKMGVGQPNVIPSGAGFPPRSLHAYIPGSSFLNTPRHQMTQGNQTPQHMTRYKLKMEQQKLKNERLQALQKALQSSEEARIAFRFSAHLEKMHSQLMNPDTVNSFRSRHDVLARLLPYHLYGESEPPPAAVEKADAVFESVAQVLLSRSRGLRSRYEQIMMKVDTEGGFEERGMKLQLERLFIEGEQERIQQENLEKKEAEQIAADLSLMADTVDSFEPDFSLGDVFDPLMSMTSGIT